MNYSNREWYAVYTIVRHEKTVNSDLTEKSVETFLPLMEVTSQWKDRKKEVQLPLFPGYLFVNIRLQDRWNVLNTRGVVKVLGVNGIPVPVPVEQIDAVKGLLESKFKYEPYPYFTQGREVVVINGPLQGVMGKIVERRNNYRLIISVDIIRRSIAIEVNIKDVELT
ncbi:MAG TPA: UpxY family transcription antiterminator [Thermodesulfobacteriota bacterium]|nr:UpxY family transcription antiterminator [Thermodesulfobacteriota bacterium]